MNQYDEVCSPIYEQIKILGKKNQVLQETRDLLLPRLISGKLSVEDIDLENIITTSMAAEPEAQYKR